MSYPLVSKPGVKLISLMKNINKACGVDKWDDESDLYNKFISNLENFEWNDIRFAFATKLDTCTCGHRIKYVALIKNKNTQIVYKIGSTCINWWFEVLISCHSEWRHLPQSLKYFISTKNKARCICCDMPTVSNKSKTAIDKNIKFYFCKDCIVDDSHIKCKDCSKTIKIEKSYGNTYKNRCMGCWIQTKR